MKLKIKNFDKIIGSRLDDWTVIGVDESNDYYSFLCQKDDTKSTHGHISNVRLKRDGIKEGTEWKYRFWHPAIYITYNQITAEWFANMDNALSIIQMELKEDFNTVI